MKRMYKIVYFLLAVFSLLSCKQSDNLPLEMSDISLKIGVRTAHAGLSNSSVWADGDEMGLFMMASGQSNLSLGMEYNRNIPIVLVEPLSFYRANRFIIQLQGRLILWLMRPIAK